MTKLLGENETERKSEGKRSVPPRDLVGYEGTAGFYNEGDRFIHCDEGEEQVIK